jgi:hypothetical protein
MDHVALATLRAPGTRIASCLSTIREVGMELERLIRVAIVRFAYVRIHGFPPQDHHLCRYNLFRSALLFSHRMSALMTPARRKLGYAVTLLLCYGLLSSNLAWPVLLFYVKWVFYGLLAVALLAALVRFVKWVWNWDSHQRG